MLKLLTRRELLNEFFSKDMLKHAVRAYKNFQDSKEQASKLSCEEAGLMLGRKAKKNLKNRGIKI
jgi:hypothetical protein